METQSKPIAKEDIPLTKGIPPSTKQVESAGLAKDSKAEGSTRYMVVGEAAMRDALIEARADIFIASQLLGITAIRLDRAISISPFLQATIDEIPKAPATASHQDISVAIDRRLSLYRVAGLDALHDLAVMPIDENSAQNQVKLAAAARLAGGLEGGGVGGEMAETFRELRDLYQKNAPRLRVIRERTTVEIEPQDERVVSDQGKQE